MNRETRAAREPEGGREAPALGGAVGAARGCTPGGTSDRWGGRAGGRVGFQTRHFRWGARMVGRDDPPCGLHAGTPLARNPFLAI